jgi:hypothetical protein
LSNKGDFTQASGYLEAVIVSNSTAPSQVKGKGKDKQKLQGVDSRQIAGMPLPLDDTIIDTAIKRLEFEAKLKMSSMETLFTVLESKLRLYCSKLRLSSEVTIY